MQTQQVSDKTQLRRLQRPNSPNHCDRDYEPPNKSIVELTKKREKSSHAIQRIR